MEPEAETLALPGAVSMPRLGLLLCEVSQWVTAIIKVNETEQTRKYPRVLPVGTLSVASENFVLVVFG